MELRKTFILRFRDEDTTATVVRRSNGEIFVETASGEIIRDALVLDGGRTVSIRRDGRMYLIDVTAPHVDPARALVNGRGGQLELLDELSAAAAAEGSSGASATELRTLMPGLVVGIKVSIGDSVEKGQSLVVLEAMKMQNELGAPGDGIVEEILCKEGQSVDANMLLVRLQLPAEDAS
jgi:biotin carboxyl carrier protein